MLLDSPTVKSSCVLPVLRKGCGHSSASTSHLSHPVYAEALTSAVHCTSRSTGVPFLSARDMGRQGFLWDIPLSWRFIKASCDYKQWLHYRLCNQCVSFVNQTDCNSCSSAAAGWNGMPVLQRGVLDKSDVSNGKCFRWWFCCLLRLHKLILEIISLNWRCDVPVSSTPSPRPVLALGDTSHFQCLLCLPVSILTGPWGGGDGWASPEGLVSDKGAFPYLTSWGRLYQTGHLSLWYFSSCRLGQVSQYHRTEHTPRAGDWWHLALLSGSLFAYHTAGVPTTQASLSAVFWPLQLVPHMLLALVTQVFLGLSLPQMTVVYPRPKNWHLCMAPLLARQSQFSVSPVSQ